ncbi:hypothetical protein, conserved [Trypanosoma brucei gambiense DAL972]|uniref:Uncharacterized protein n=3 Tax=Trypanosoma brucei TaxID=5691 RepID=Q385B6_TRYB2|nr:hypothetical protein, conserved [Trypanosoma brucei gambiense DAL972]XP_828727.1 hypothetical protein, conserved [Trypanosoma brucei brucei TREU927]EAN79615.1 hypothetical protein, conserved [Trypanosoma brucei brucei TREU927]RHW67015.1 hypothetical protein DPX39_000038900 [Trypanosoma brucei equiperdum]CBH17618.1 hypothetical protein, conserved [Trypanosoma brucei gambiense DAL972]|eukprot:XP_011779882.1 hypothetical protein, conserved [Trypanosoma brucei gambiense DAL972]
MFGGSKSDLIMSPPPHPKANMLDLYMTRYDYDYNRDIDPSGQGEKKSNFTVSGEVRNRPIFRAGAQTGGEGTTYRSHYVKHDVEGKDFRDILQSCCRAGEPETAFVHGRSTHVMGCSTGDGVPPNTTYKTDYVYNGRSIGGEPQLYAGAKATAFSPNLLAIPPTEEELRKMAEVAPKITSIESLAPKPKPSLEGLPANKEDLLASRRPQLTTGGHPTDYYCTSWVYGDKSLVYPSQLPCGLTNSQNGHLIGTIQNKAELLALLAGRKKAAAKATNPMPDTTNPIAIDKAAQPYCGVTRRLENEGHVKMSMYKSNYIDQAVLPELPDAAVQAGNHDPNDESDTTNRRAATTNAGTLTKRMHRLGTLRNSHGYVHKQRALDSDIDLQTWRRMRIIEKRIDVDKADPHRHKLNHRAHQ